MLDSATAAGLYSQPRDNHKHTLFGLCPDKKMNGMSFGLSDEEEWKTFGISDSGLIILKKRIMKLVNPSSDMPVSNVSPPPPYPLLLVM